MLRKLTFESFKFLNCNDFVYEFKEPIMDFSKIPPYSEKKPLFTWWSDNNCEKNKETMTLEVFQNLFTGYLYIKTVFKVA